MTEPDLCALAALAGGAVVGLAWWGTVRGRSATNGATPHGEKRGHIVTMGEAGFRARMTSTTRPQGSDSLGIRGSGVVAVGGIEPPTKGL